MSQCHFDSTASWYKPGIDHHIASDVHRVLQVALHLVQNIFACTTQHDGACLRVLALHQECEVSTHGTNDYCQNKCGLAAADMCPCGEC